MTLYSSKWVNGLYEGFRAQIISPRRSIVSLREILTEKYVLGWRSDTTHRVVVVAGTAMPVTQIVMVGDKKHEHAQYQ